LTSPGGVFGFGSIRKENTMSGPPLTFRRPTGQTLEPLKPDDYEVVSDGEIVGSIVKTPPSVPDDRWMWRISGKLPGVPSHGFCASLDEAKAKFAETWRAWRLGGP